MLTLKNKTNKTHINSLLRIVMGKHQKFSHSLNSVNG